MFGACCAVLVVRCVHFFKRSFSLVHVSQSMRLDGSSDQNKKISKPQVETAPT